MSTFESVEQVMNKIIDSMDPNDNPGKDLLISDLRAKPQSVERDIIISNAQRSHYSDFRSYWVTPALMLIQHLTQAGFTDMVQNAKDAAYDHDT